MLNVMARFGEDHAPAFAAFLMGLLPSSVAHFASAVCVCAQMMYLCGNVV